MLVPTTPFRLFIHSSKDTLFNSIQLHDFDFVLLLFKMQGACVQNVLDSLIPALLADKNRKFIYVEQARIKTIIYVALTLHIKAVFGVRTTLTHQVIFKYFVLTCQCCVSECPCLFQCFIAMHAISICICSS